MSAHLTSTDGWTRLVLSDLRSGEAAAATLTVEGRFWERDVSIEDASLVPDFVLNVCRLQVEMDQLTGLQRALTTWAELPLPELAGRPFTGRYELASGATASGQSAMLAFSEGPRPGSATCDVLLSQARILASVTFVTDSTSLAAFAAGLGRLGP